MDWHEIPACALAGVMHEVLQSVLGLRVMFGDQERILIEKLDVKNAFRQIPVDPDGGIRTRFQRVCLRGWCTRFHRESSGEGQVWGSGAYSHPNNGRQKRVQTDPSRP